jgi:hypothetical protein
MKKSCTLFLFVSLLAAGSFVLSARVQNDVYAMEFKTVNNHSGAINLMNGTFIGAALPDVAPMQRP